MNSNRSFWGGTRGKSRHTAAAWREQPGPPCRAPLCRSRRVSEKSTFPTGGQRFTCAEPEYIEINMPRCFNRLRRLLLRHNMRSRFRSEVCATYHILSHMYIHIYTREHAHIYGMSAYRHVLPALVLPLKSSFEKSAQIRKDYIDAPVHASYYRYTATCRSFSFPVHKTRFECF